MTSPGSDLAALRRTVQSVCAYCGKPIAGLARKKYCSASHRASDANRRKAERRKSVAPAVAPSDR